jgi:hypothetical protein
MGLLTDTQDDCVKIVESLLPVSKSSNGELKNIIDEVVVKALSLGERAKNEIVLRNKPKTKEQIIQEQLHVLRIKQTKEDREREESEKFNRSMRALAVPRKPQQQPIAQQRPYTQQSVQQAMPSLSNGAYAPLPSDGYYTKLAKQMKSVDDIVAKANASTGQFIDDLFVPSLQSIAGNKPLSGSLSTATAGARWCRPSEFCGSNPVLIGSSSECKYDEVIQGSLGDCWLLYDLFCIIILHLFLQTN